MLNTATQPVKAHASIEQLADTTEQKHTRLELADDTPASLCLQL